MPALLVEMPAEFVETELLRAVIAAEFARPVVSVLLVAKF